MILLFFFVLLASPLLSTDRKQGEHFVSGNSGKTYFETVQYYKNRDIYINFNKKSLVSKHIVYKTNCLTKYLCNSSSFYAEDNITTEVAYTRNKKVRIKIENHNEEAPPEFYYLDLSSSRPHLTYFSVEQYIKDNHLNISQKKNDKIKLLIPAMVIWLNVKIIETSSTGEYKNYSVKTDNLVLRPLLGSIKVRFSLKEKKIVRYEGIHFARLVSGVWSLGEITTRVYYNIL